MLKDLLVVELRREANEIKQGQPTFKNFYYKNSTVLKETDLLGITTKLLYDDPKIL